MNNGPLIVCVAWITAWVAFAYAEIGEVYDCPSSPVPWHMPILMLSLIGFPAVFAYLHGKNVGRAKRTGADHD